VSTTRLGKAKAQELRLAIAFLLASLIAVGGSDVASSDTAQCDATLSWSDPDAGDDPASSTADDAVTLGSSTFNAFFAVRFARHRIARVGASVRRARSTPSRAPPDRCAARAFQHASSCRRVLPSRHHRPRPRFQDHHGNVLRRG
jgi:hypothetical protein